MKRRIKNSFAALNRQKISDSFLLSKRLIPYRGVVVLFLLTVLFFVVSTVRAAAGDEIAQSAPEKIPLEIFAKLPVFSMPVISPDGKHIAYRLIKNGKPLLIIQPIPKNGEVLDEPIRPIGIGDKFIQEFDWANNDRLIVNIRTSVTGKKEGGFYNRLLSVGVDPEGASPVDLLAKLKKRNKKSYHMAESSHRPRMLDRLKYDNKKILAVLEYTLEQTGQGGRYYFSVPDFHEVDIYSGKSRRRERNSRLLRSVIADENDQVRVGWFSQAMPGYEHNRYKLYYRANENLDWELVQRIKYLEHDNLKPLRFDYDDPNILLVSIREQGSDYNLIDDTKYPIYRYDLKKQQVIGEYKNATQLKLKAMLAKALPDLEHEIVSVDEERTSYIVKSFSGRQPTIYYLVDLNTKALNRLGREYPLLESKELVPREEIQFKARDGEMITAFLTLPEIASGQKPPLVVLPHGELPYVKQGYDGQPYGGPFSKDEEGFDKYAHFLASRGYVVIQPQFRGSTGRGLAYEEAGYGEWARKMQHDITDSARWLIDENRVDSQKICIVGAGFGGYAAAWGALNQPRLYQCSVSINGVMDLQEFIRRNNYSLIDWQGRLLFNDRTDVDDQSPYRQAKKIKIPLLLIAARGDAVVPYQHSSKLYKKMKANNQDVTYLELKAGEHWQSNEEDEIKILMEMEEFLALHLL